MTRRRENEKGIALLVTLLILVLIVALVYEVFRIGAQSAQTGAYGRDSIRCILLAEGGTGAARIALRVDARDNRYDTLDEVWSRTALPIELGDGEVMVTIEDEERKIDLNHLMLPNGNAPDARRLAVFQRLLDILGIDRAVADAVVDWLDNDENPRVGGAESSYYLGLPNPYRAKNDLFDTIGELRLVSGVTDEIYEKLSPLRDRLLLRHGEHQHRAEGGPDVPLGRDGPDGGRGDRREDRGRDHRIPDGPSVHDHEPDRKRLPVPAGSVRPNLDQESRGCQIDVFPRALVRKRRGDRPDHRRHRNPRWN